MLKVWQSPRLIGHRKPTKKSEDRLACRVFGVGYEAVYESPSDIKADDGLSHHYNAECPIDAAAWALECAMHRMDLRGELNKMVACEAQRGLFE